MVLLGKTVTVYRNCLAQGKSGLCFFEEGKRRLEETEEMTDMTKCLRAVTVQWSRCFHLLIWK